MEGRGRAAWITTCIREGLASSTGGFETDGQSCPRLGFSIDGKRWFSWSLMIAWSSRYHSLVFDRGLSVC